MSKYARAAPNIWPYPYHRSVEEVDRYSKGGRPKKNRAVIPQNVEQLLDDTPGCAMEMADRKSAANALPALTSNEQGTFVMALIPLKGVMRPAQDSAAR